jgi:4-amino-4-deoxy-L-arabinose transferase-like glycosyltransferase
VTAGLWAALLIVLPYLGFLGSHQLWPPFEPELAETAREMHASHDLVVPRLNGKVFADKPPLYYWTALAAAGARDRLDETAARLPSALSLVLLVVVTGAFGAHVLGWRVGLLAGLILATTPLSFLCGTAAMCDMPLALCVSVAIFLVHEATSGDKARGGLLVLAGAVLGLSVLAKSVLGPALVFLATVPPLALDRERRIPGPRYWALAAGAFTVVVLPWFIAIGVTQGRGFLFEVLVHQTFDRFVGRGDSKGNFLHYIVSLPGDLFPWTLLLPLGALHAACMRRERPERWRRLRFLLVGLGIELAFLSVSSCRIGKYALPLFPQIALVLGDALESAHEGAARRLASRTFQAIAGGIAVASAVTPFVIARWIPSLAELAAWGIALALASAVALQVLARIAHPATAAVGFAVALSAGGVFTGAWVYPAVDEIRTDRALEEAIVRNVSPDAPFASYGIATRSFILFYTERTTREFYGRPDLDQWLASLGPRPAYVLTRDDYYPQLSTDDGLGRRLRTVGRNPAGVGHDDYLLVEVLPP